MHPRAIVPVVAEVLFIAALGLPNQESIGGQSPVSHARQPGSPARVPGDQMRSVDKSRLGSRIGTLSPAELSAVEEAVPITLGFQP